MRKTYCICFMLLVLLSGCSRPLLKTVGKPQSPLTLRQDTIWEGVVIVEGEVFIPQGVTLRVKPGTIIRFKGKKLISDELKRHDIIDGAGLKVEGKIEALGTSQLPIFFTSSQEKPQAGDWDKILINHSQGSVFDHCYLEYADFAFHAHFAAVTIKNSVIRYNNEGFRLGASHFMIAGCRIEFNQSRGLNSRAGQNEVIHNEIVDNGVGIFLYEENQQSSIKENNIYHNQDYNLRLGDFHQSDVKLENNWWGTTDMAEIAAKIWDKHDDPNIGQAIITLANHPWEIKP